MPQFWAQWARGPSPRIAGSAGPVVTPLEEEKKIPHKPSVLDPSLLHVSGIVYCISNTEQFKRHLKTFHFKSAFTDR